MYKNHKLNMAPVLLWDKINFDILDIKNWNSLSDLF